MELDTEREERLKYGGIAGAVAFVAGLVIASVVESGLTQSDYQLFRAENVQGSETGLGSGSNEPMTYGELSELTSQLSQGSFGPPSSFQLSGWLYHQAHFASIDGSMSVQFSGDLMSDQSVTADLVFIGEPSTLLYLTPLVLVAAAGYWVSDQFQAADATEAAKDGAHVAVGYGVLALLSVFLLGWGGTGEISAGLVSGSITMNAGPALVSAVVLTGIIYPIVVGGAGAYVGHEYLGDDEAEVAPSDHAAGDRAPADDFDREDGTDEAQDHDAQ